MSSSSVMSCRSSVSKIPAEFPLNSISHQLTRAYFTGRGYIKIIHKITLGPVAYLGFPAPGGKLSFGAPTQPLHGSSIDAKNELGVKGRRKLTRTACL